MMKNRIYYLKGITPFVSISFLVMALCTGCLQKTSVDNNLQHKIESVGIYENIRVLTNKEYEGRRGGSKGEAETAFFLAGFMQDMKLIPAGEDNTYFQSFEIADYLPVKLNDRQTFRMKGVNPRYISENILGVLPGKKDEIIVISAHYDHLGIINGEMYPGANDNASGVACIMEMISHLHDKERERTILFVFWGAEEMGLLGSRAFCQNPTIPLDNIKFVINLDSIGNIKDDKKLLIWQGEENEIAKEIKFCLIDDGWDITLEENKYCGSDHASFLLKNVHAMTILSYYWLDKNHTIKDNLREVNTRAIYELSLCLEKLL